MTSHHDVADSVAWLRQPRWIEGSFQKKLFDIADILESQAKALSEANDHIQQLQRALSFWMPGVTEASDIETNGRVADDAYLLMGYNGPISDDCWGDRTHKRALAVEARLAEAMKVIEPFSLVAEHDIGLSETDADTYRPMTYNTVPNITVGQLRAARAFTNAAKEKTDAQSE